MQNLGKLASTMSELEKVTWKTIFLRSFITLEMSDYAVFLMMVVCF